MRAYIGRWEDSRDLERPPFARRIWKVLEDSGEVHTCVEGYGRKEILLCSSRDLFFFFKSRDLLYICVHSRIFKNSLGLW